ncbi:hypothetical protein DFJ73DRAFT_873108, partial [Zopfochytrium polystomum]
MPAVRLLWPPEPVSVDAREAMECRFWNMSCGGAWCIWEGATSCGPGRWPGRDWCGKVVVWYGLRGDWAVWEGGRLKNDCCEMGAIVTGLAPYCCCCWWYWLCTGSDPLQVGKRAWDPRSVVALFGPKCDEDDGPPDFPCIRSPKSCVTIRAGGRRPRDDTSGSGGLCANSSIMRIWSTCESESHRPRTPKLLGIENLRDSCGEPES